MSPKKTLEEINRRFFEVAADDSRGMSAFGNHQSGINGIYTNSPWP